MFDAPQDDEAQRRRTSQRAGEERTSASSNLPNEGEGEPRKRLPLLFCLLTRQIQIYLAYGSMSGKVAVSVLLDPDVIVSVTSVKVTLTRTGVIPSGHVKPAVVIG